MTIDEALHNIKQGYGIPHKHDTLATIIEYVKQTEPCEDAVSRQAVISAICRWGVSLEKKGICSVTTHEMKQTCADMILDLPKVEPVSCIAKFEIDKDQMQEIVEKQVKEMVETCEDAISRKAVLDEMGDINMDIYTDEVKEFVENLPSVQPKAKTGKWIYDSRHAPFNWECTECGISFKTDFSYCPNCGAKMEGEEE